MSSSVTQSVVIESATSSPICGEIAVPGDKSISHRALMIASQVIGDCSINGLLEGEDVLNTARALRRLGVDIERSAPGCWLVHGVGVGGLRESDNILDMGNSGTGARLMMGLLSSYPFTSFFTGDSSLRGRPMQRVITPLQQSGAVFTCRDGGKLPIALRGAEVAQPLSYTLPVASAQVKSAILFAALNIAGKSSVTEPRPTRDHTERMLGYFGFDIDVSDDGNGGRVISLCGQQEISVREHVLQIPGDPSSAAFPMVAALVIPGSHLLIRNLCVNSLRTGLFVTLQEMGANMKFRNRRVIAGEDVADIEIYHSKLHGIEVPAERAPSMIDEYPILAVAAAFAEGKTVMHGLAELKVKESDRLAAIIDGLRLCGVAAAADGDSLAVEGGGPGSVPGGTAVTTHFDHRIAMSFLIMGMAATNPVRIDDGSSIATSFPNFIELMNGIGAAISPSDLLKGHKRRRATDIFSAPVPPLVIAIDGSAASGKGTLARRLADSFNFAYLDTGMLYRAVGLKLINSGKDPADKQAATEAAQSISAKDLSDPRLRHEQVGKAASIVSAIPEVRELLLEYQRKVAASGNGAVLDGRDIGTVVCPGADIKLFLTANLEDRAKRRHRQLQSQGIEVIYESVLRDLRERDSRDSERATAPMVPATDAVVIDTSCDSADEVFRKVMGIIKDKISDEDHNGCNPDIKSGAYRHSSSTS